MFSIKLTVDDNHIELPYNHVHHASSLRYLEHARVEFLKEIGHANADYIARNIFVVISAIEVAYLREVLAGEITVTCEDVEVDGKLVRIRQRLINAKGKTCIRAMVGCMFMDGSSRRAIKPPDGFIQAVRYCKDLFQEPVSHAPRTHKKPPPSVQSEGGGRVQ